MKTKPATTKKSEPRKSRTLFGLSDSDLQMVLGGTGVLQQSPVKK